MCEMRERYGRCVYNFTLGVENHYHSQRCLNFAQLVFKYKNPGMPGE